MSGAYCSFHELLRLQLRAKPLALFQQSMSRSLMFGGARSPFKGRGVDFEEVRAYQFGDDVRTIDWRVTARRMKPHTKVFQEEREKPVLVVLDQSHSLFFGSQHNFKSVTAAEAAGCIGWATLQHGDRIGGVVFNEESIAEIRPRRSKQTLMNLLHQTEKMNRALSANLVFTDKAQLGLTKALRHARRVSHPGTHVFIISDFNGLMNDTRQHLHNLSKHCQVIGLHVSDPLEKALPKPGDYTITNGQHRLSLHTGDLSLRKSFSQAFETRQQWLADELCRYRIPLLPLSAAEDTCDQLLSLFGAQPSASSNLRGDP